MLRNPLLCAVFGALFVAALMLPSRADDSFKLLELDGRPVKWGMPVPRTGAVITYKLATDSSVGGLTNCRRTTPVAPLLAHSHLAARDFEQALDGALRAWEAVADVHFMRVSSNSPANLTIGAERDPDGIAYTDVTPVSPTGGAISAAARAVICLNPRLAWSLQRKHGAKRLGYVLEHEIGHALGLDHPGPTGEMMSFEYSDMIDGLQPGDMAGIISLYGPARQAGAIALNATHH